MSGTKKKSSPAENSGENSGKPKGRIENIEPHKFQPGQSGNPGGRPKKKPITEAYAELLSNPEKARLLAEAIFNAAVNDKSVFAAREITDRLEGKSLQAVRLDGELGITTAQERKTRMVQLLRKAAERIEGL